MLRVGLRVSLEDFLLDVRKLFSYSEDDPEIDTYIYLWREMEETHFSKLVCEMLNIEISFRGTDSDGEDERWRQYEDEKCNIYPQLRHYGRKGQLVHDLAQDEFFDFAYALAYYLEYDVSELQCGIEVDSIDKRGDRLDVTLS